MSQRDVQTNLGRVFFCLQMKAIYDVTPALLRDARVEWDNFRERLPDALQSDLELNFFYVYNMLDYLEDNKYGKALETVSDAYKEYHEMLKFFPTVPAVVSQHNSPRMSESVQQDFIEEHDSALPGFGRGLKKGGGGDSFHWASANGRLSRSTHISQASSSRRTEDRQLGPERQAIYDMSTPIQLTEQFNILYADDWTAAFADVSKVTGDVQAIRHLLWVIAKASNLCVTTAAQQLDGLEAAVSGIMVCKDPLMKEPLPKDLVPYVEDGRSVLAEYRKELASLSATMLKSDMRKAIADEMGASLPRRFSTAGSQFMDYAEKCVELVWLMYVHDPPLYLEWLTKEQEDETFDTELYRPYTKMGADYEYCVWPVLRAHRGGPILSKGIAQGK